MEKHEEENGSAISKGDNPEEEQVEEVTKGGVVIKKRETWARKMDFLMACIGGSVGLGNVWRFPYLCYKNGGGAFLLPYFLAVFIAGVPMFFLEVSLGQFMANGAIGAWNICPLMRGLGFAVTIIRFLQNVYYNVIMAWGFYYLFASFASITTYLPWTTCDNEWNTKTCVRSIHDAINALNATNTTTLEARSLPSNASIALASNISEDEAFDAWSMNASLWTDPTTEFWEKKVLHLSPGIEVPGNVRWDLALCLLLSWIVVYLCIWKGIKSSGKVMYFTATSPYVFMFILLIRGVTLPGAVNGIYYYLVPTWEKLADPQVWVDAGTQVFFSSSISVGTLISLGSYNKFKHNCWKDCLVYTGVNCGTSFLAGFVIFSILGFMAYERGISVADVAESGPGLAFIAYPKAVGQLVMAPVWSIIFFIMIILLGLDSQFVGVEGVVTTIVDEFPHQLRRGYRKEILIAFICAISMLCGLCMVTEGGMYVFQLFDYYSGNKMIMVIAFLECITVAYLYGVRRYYDNLTLMIGYPILPYMKVAWSFITPIFTLAIFGISIHAYSELKYNRVYTYPQWAIVLGWMMASSSIFMVPTVAVISTLRGTGSLKERLKHLLLPRLKDHQITPNDLHKPINDEPLMNGHMNEPLNCHMIDLTKV
ncbi:hypothetical protein CAPTEDRAFT_166533 [Capitella teleta]|uniref:Transporter n=1 Tax=Capitella teleta TaxID=283909 RepID=R7UXJ8_CAPTE|nr:hypothetical protein CAPTEDRAFT_166533 [Capitella teleta]|eukprot:ELU08111.1 hypothetical protein CAPTEDRAFT_166533 [Capitella teleta]